MLTITGRNVNEIFAVGIFYLNELGKRRDSRNGPTLEIPGPVSVRYNRPLENVLFDQERDINPFLHFFEPLWILAGRKDVSFMKEILPKFEGYSDNQTVFNGAYGHRMRHHRGFDQVRYAIEALKKNPDDRRCVLVIRTPEDSNYDGLDSPCNIAVALRIWDNKLNIHVFNRSNDFIWGLAGTNAVQFSVLQEYMAGHIGCEVGEYHQTTNCMHVYTETPQWEKLKNIPLIYEDPYELRQVSHYPMISDPEGFEWDLKKFFEEFDLDVTEQDPSCYCSLYFQKVVIPMWNTFVYHKYDKAGLAVVDEVMAADWHLVTKRWIEKRNPFNGL